MFVNGIYGTSPVCTSFGTLAKYVVSPTFGAGGQVWNARSALEVWNCAWFPLLEVYGIEGPHLECNKAALWHSTSQNSSRRAQSSETLLLSPTCGTLPGYSVVPFHLRGRWCVQLLHPSIKLGARRAAMVSELGSSCAALKQCSISKRRRSIICTGPPLDTVKKAHFAVQPRRHSLPAASNRVFQTPLGALVSHSSRAASVGVLARSFAEDKMNGGLPHAQTNEQTNVRTNVQTVYTRHLPHFCTVVNYITSVPSSRDARKRLITVE